MSTSPGPLVDSDTPGNPTGMAHPDRATRGPGARRAPADVLPASQRRDQADATRAQLLLAAERLYAERGISEVSNRQVAEAAGSANNSAVGYYIGTKTDLVAAVSRAHSEPVARRMREKVEAVRGSSDPRDHVACLVLAYTEHLAGLGTPSWYARILAQTVAAPSLGDAVAFDPALDTRMRHAFDAMWACCPAAPPEVVALRQQMIRVMVVHTCAEQERASARTGIPADWTLVGHGLVQAVTAVLLAPV